VRLGIRFLCSCAAESVESFLSNLGTQLFICSSLGGSPPIDIGGIARILFGTSDVVDEFIPDSGDHLGTSTA
jgi:hypothetical protein